MLIALTKNVHATMMPELISSETVHKLITVPRLFMSNNVSLMFFLFMTTMCQIFLDFSLKKKAFKFYFCVPFLHQKICQNTKMTL